MGSPIGLNVTRTTAWKMMTSPAEFDPDSARQWMADNWHRSFYLAGAYLLFLRAGRMYMKDRAPFQMPRLLILWNALLTAFSLLGTYYTLPEFISHLRKYGYFDSYCTVDGYYRKQPQAFWIWAFHFSKAPELGDTVFLILRKKPVSFLHLYHHTSVLLWCWFCYQYWSAPPRWGVAMNYAVHAIMYAYYTARAAGWRLPSIAAPMVTTLQLAQFLVCVPLNAVALYKTYYPTNRESIIDGVTVTVNDCDTTLTLALLQQFLYNTYFLLFAQFFYKAYIKRGKGSKEE